MRITSNAFSHGGKIPSKYTCDAPEKERAPNPVFEIFDIPLETKSLVLIMDDPDASNGVWDHWVIFDIEPAKSGVQKGTFEISEGEKLVGTFGKNSWGGLGYGGPCPHTGVHRYFFKIYALDSMLNLPEGSTKNETEIAMAKHVLERAEIVGMYERQAN